MTKPKPYLDRAEKLKSLRGDISTDKFAKELGINLTTYYRYERGETIEKTPDTERGTQRGRAFDLLAKIYESADQQLIGAIFSNLKSFAEAAEQKRENVKLNLKLEGLESKIDDLEAQLNQKGIIRLRDRRSGADRRRVAGENHAGEERRAGGDRRKDVVNNGATA